MLETEPQNARPLCSLMKSEDEVRAGVKVRCIFSLSHWGPLSNEEERLGTH